MKTSPTLLASLLVPTLAAALATLSCAGGETAGSPGTGSTTGNSGGSSGTATGGRSGTGTGGSSFGSGGSTFNSGGSTGAGSGGSSFGTGGSSFGTGGSSFGTGGSTGIGTGGSTGAGTGGSTSTGALAVVDGFGTSGTWMGYGYTFVGPATGSKATIMPANFMAMTSLCASGMITADTTYASVAGMGWNVNQAKGTTATEPPIMTVATSGTGLAISVGSVTGLTLAAGAGSQLRAQVKTAAGDYCAPIPAAGTSMIPWTMFNTKCWNTSEAGATAFAAGTAIRAVELVIPSTAAATIGPFNMCLTDARPY